MPTRSGPTGTDRQLRLAPVVAIFIAMITLSGCQSEALEQQTSSRIVVLGFDGMDPELVKRWMEEDKLPNFERLRRQGSFSTLATTNPAQSPVAWSSFATGLTPGEHGIYDFIRRDPKTYLPEFAISETVPPETALHLFGLSIPLDDPVIRNRRLGEPFWQAIERLGGKTTILRVPVTYPPDDVHHMLSGMGVPDLRGTQGEYTLYTTRPIRFRTQGQVVPLRPGPDGTLEATLEGPPHPLLDQETALRIPLRIRPKQTGVEVSLDGDTLSLLPGRWSDWVPVRFPFLGLLSVSGMVRMHLANQSPLTLYVSPINIDPLDPAVPLSSPPSYATELARRLGRFHTIGMPEETWSLNEGHISDEAFLEVIRTTLAERESMFFEALHRHDSDVVVAVFVQTDRVSHMFYRGIDPAHPLHSVTGEPGRNAIEWVYREADRILGRTLDALSPDDELIVLSDHGFAPFRRAVNLNRWLADKGYLVFGPRIDAFDSDFDRIDWSRSVAYALGLNGVYLNLAGREAQGIVTPDQAPSIKQAIRRALEQEPDPQTGEPFVDTVFDGADIYPANANGDAPDLVVGYRRGYRASWQTTVGEAPAALVEPNFLKWSGDHGVAPGTVPGILFTSFRQSKAITEIDEIAPYIVAAWKRAHASNPG